MAKKAMSVKIILSRKGERQLHRIKNEWKNIAVTEGDKVEIVPGDCVSITYGDDALLFTNATSNPVYIEHELLEKVEDTEKEIELWPEDQSLAYLLEKKSET